MNTTRDLQQTLDDDWYGVPRYEEDTPRLVFLVLRPTILVVVEGVGVVEFSAQVIAMIEKPTKFLAIVLNLG